MEEKKQEQRPQYFYFTDDGKLVVESNKGVWVDGEQYVKMYGNFTCNAKTMGIIISQLKNMPAFISREKCRVVIDAITGDKKFLTESVGCIINPNAEQAGLLSEISEKDTTIKEKNENIAELKKKTGEDGDKIYKLERSIMEFNELPWHKRIFKKIEIKNN